MACFTVSLAEAIVVKVVQKKIAKKEKLAAEKNDITAQKPLIPMSTRLGWLSKLLFGGSALLAFEHVWHGEIVPFFPFLTAMSNPADAAAMFREMATVGVTMAVIITAVWFVMCKVSDAILAKDSETAVQES